jgi:hypothetical protein
MPSGKVFAQSTIETSYFWLCNQILVDFLTQDEVDRLNKEANNRYSEVREKERFEKAIKIPESEWAGSVYSEGHGWNDGYFNDIDDLKECLEDEDAAEIEYVWACDEEASCYLDLDRILESATEDTHEDFRIDDLNGLEELKLAINKFNELNKDQVSWNINFKKAIILD